MRTYVYIDGFNFYYGAVKGTPYKWLDFKSLCKDILAPHHDILSIKYFTARVKPMGDANRPLRQEVYFSALKKQIPEFSIYFGHFLSHPAYMPLVSNPAQKAQVLKTEEKGSDVNLALHLLNDAWHNRYDCAILISNDSDLAEALRMIKTDHNKKIGWLVPKNLTRNNISPSRELSKLADFRRFINKATLAACQLPNPIPGTNIHKPASW